ncbi:MAG TPA: DUF2254 domain-containing protein [Gemmatimonadales bacterium]|nr:DUF2254 domain-containing protein [Gemmatimonadales bacterium]
MARIRLLWNSVRGSLWFVPAVSIAVAVLLAVGLIELDARLGRDYGDRLPRLFGVGAEGSRSMLEAVATSVVTIAGVAFSITIVALSLTSQQYSSRVLRNFMRDRANQAVLGMLAGVFAYCLVVLRTIRSDEDGFVPSFAVLGGVVLAFVALGAFIFFIHHIALSIQASHILAMVSRDTVAAIDALFPERLGDEPPAEEPTSDPALVWRPVLAPRSGVIEAVQEERMLAFARKHGAVVRMEHGIGDFAVEGLPLASVGTPAPGARTGEEALLSCYRIGRERTVEQDAGYGVRQLVDVALKALSPGINDTTTAVAVIDWLTAVLARLAGRRVESPHRYDAGVLRVIARGPTYPRLLAEAFEQIRQHGAGNVAILGRLLDAFATLEQVTGSADRRAALAEQVERVREAAGRSIAASFELNPLDERASALLKCLRRG